MDIPINLEDWNYKIIKQLVELGATETDKFDFKKDLQVRELDKTVCAFANTDGGFIIFGILDEKEQKHNKNKDRIEGISESLKYDFKTHFYNQINNCSPNIINFEMREPTIEIPQSSNFLQVISIKKSNNRPHMTQGGVFYRRVNGSNEPMQYHQIRRDFYDLEERKFSVKRTNLSFVAPPFLETSTWKNHIENDGEKQTVVFQEETKMKIGSNEIKGVFSPHKKNIDLGPGGKYTFPTMYKEISDPKSINKDDECSIYIKLKYSDGSMFKKFENWVSIDVQDVIKYSKQVHSKKLDLSSINKSRF